VEGRFALWKRSGSIRDKSFQELLHGDKPNKSVAYVECHVEITF
jgi:hypothetical protein